MIGADGWRHAAAFDGAATCPMLAMPLALCAAAFAITR